MPTFLLANNANTTLAAGISSTATSFTVATGTGALFPDPATGQAFQITLITAAPPSLINEIVQCTSRSGDTFTIVRGQEGTTPVAWLQGDLVYQLITAGTLAGMSQVVGSQSAAATLSGASPMTYTPTVQGNVVIEGGTLTALTITRNSVVIPLDIGTKSFHLSANDLMTLTYSAAPTNVSFMPS